MAPETALLCAFEKGSRLLAAVDHMRNGVRDA